MLAYEVADDLVYEYVHMRDWTSVDTMYKFYIAMVKQML
jgi:hypothetical protein